MGEKSTGGKCYVQRGVSPNNEGNWVNNVKRSKQLADICTTHNVTTLGTQKLKGTYTCA